ncbi:unnamed protein product [Caenorhabditis auriculariae]|uniref:Ground-like domain-containing protein n=1 Tax=Caenorhabditis auriculariae TaxID=2777116 RepID=A0A8S1H778_9PELO|nr:unnamed protein product [Caenorhabditis auriculariae]
MGSRVLNRDHFPVCPFGETLLKKKDLVISNPTIVLTLRQNRTDYHQRSSNSKHREKTVSDEKFRNNGSGKKAWKPRTQPLSRTVTRKRVRGTNSSVLPYWHYGVQTSQTNLDFQNHNVIMKASEDINSRNQTNLSTANRIRKNDVVKKSIHPLKMKKKVELDEKPGIQKENSVNERKSSFNYTAQDTSKLKTQTIQTIDKTKTTALGSKTFNPVRIPHYNFLKPKKASHKNPNDLVLFLQSSSVRRKPAVPISPPRFLLSSLNRRVKEGKPCYINKYGFECCDKQLETIMLESYEQTKKRFKEFSLRTIAESIKQDANKFFNDYFESVVSIRDFYITAESSLFCKIQADNYIIHAYKRGSANNKAKTDFNRSAEIPFHELTRDRIKQNATIILANLD